MTRIALQLCVRVDDLMGAVREKVIARGDGPVLAEVIAHLKEALVCLQRAGEAAGRESPVRGRERA